MGGVGGGEYLAWSRTIGPIRADGDAVKVEPHLDGLLSLLLSVANVADVGGSGLSTGAEVLDSSSPRGLRSDKAN